MSTLTFEKRLEIREAYDRRARLLLADEKSERCCTGCGADYASRTQGCRACTDRSRDRVKRVNPRPKNMRAQCKGSTYYGSRCMNTALDGDFCYAHRQVTA